MSYNQQPPPNKRRRLNEAPSNGHQQHPLGPQRVALPPPQAQQATHHPTSVTNGASNHRQHRSHPPRPPHPAHNGPQRVAIPPPAADKRSQRQPQRQATAAAAAAAPPQKKRKDRIVRFNGLMLFQPSNGLHMYVSKWISDIVVKSVNIEFETKLGLLLKLPDMLSTNSVNEQNDQRLDLGIHTPAVINADRTRSRFKSGITIDAFKHLNKLLNQWYANSVARPEDRNRILLNANFPQIQYKRVKEIDKLYDNHIRVSLRCDRPNVVSEAITKESKGVLDICLPRCDFDMRITAKVEKKAPPDWKMKSPPPQLQRIRCKDRISFAFDVFSIDVTAISTYSDTTRLTKPFIEHIRQKMNGNQAMPIEGGLERTFEVEIEVADKEWLQHQRQLTCAKQPSQFLDMVLYLVSHTCNLAAVIQQPKPGSSNNRWIVPNACKMPER